MATNYTFRPVCDICELCDLRPWFCAGCNQNLCSKCKKKHVEEAICINHRILPIARENEEMEMDKPESIEKTENGVKRCHHHDDEVINRYCASCNELVCSICWNENHDGHIEREIQKIADELMIKMSNQVLPEMRVELEKLDSSIEAVRNNKFEYTACARSIRSEISDKVKFLVSSVEHTQASLLTELSTLEDHDLEILRMQESNLIENKKLIEKLLKTYETNSHAGNPLSFLMHVLQTGETYKTADDVYPPLSSVNPPSLCDVEYVTKASIAKIFGKIRKNKREKEIIPLAHHPRIPNEMFDVSIRNVSYLYLSDNEAAYCIRTLSDGTAWIGTGEQSVRLVNKDGAVKREHTLDFYPYNIAVAGDGTLLLSKGNSVQKISTESTISDFFVSRSHFVQGLCTTRRGEVLVCLTKKDNGKIVKLCKQGTISQEIEFDHRGNYLFVNPTKIAENPVTGDICVEDSSQCSIIVVSSHGEHLFTYKGRTGDTFSPFYITCDMHGHILIGDNSHFRIHLLKSNGEFVQYLLSQEDGLYSPWGMDERDGQLWVGTLSGKIWIIEYEIHNDSTN